MFQILTPPSKIAVQQKQATVTVQSDKTHMKEETYKKLQQNSEQQFLERYQIPSFGEYA
ncbi:11062_t:CDS:2, partial [Acaulospora morrowiae]